jgi:hypothetical protein
MATRPLDACPKRLTPGNPAGLFTVSVTYSLNGFEKKLAFLKIVVIKSGYGNRDPVAGALVFAELEFKVFEDLLDPVVRVVRIEEGVLFVEIGNETNKKY